MPGIIYEDFVVEESMGPIVDRSKEYIGSSNALIIRIRHELLRLARTPAGPPAGIDYPAMRARNGMLPEGADWRQALRYR